MKLKSLWNPSKSLQQSHSKSTTEIECDSPESERRQRSSSPNIEIIDRNNLWLQISLEAIQNAKSVQRDVPSRQVTMPIELLISRQRSLMTVKESDTQSTAQETSMLSLKSLVVEEIQNSAESVVHRCASLEPPATPQPVARPRSPDEVEVTILELIVHYLTCGHVLREDEVRDAPQLLECSASSKSTHYSSRPPPGLTVSASETYAEEDDDDDATTLYSDDDPSRISVSSIL